MNKGGMDKLRAGEEIAFYCSSVVIVPITCIIHLIQLHDDKELVVLPGHPVIRAHAVAAPCRLEDHSQLPPQGLNRGVRVEGSRLEGDNLDGDLKPGA
jgi:hypothetical protein